MTSSIKIDAIVAAAQGCSHAVAVIESVRDQLQSGEVLFIMEGQECGLSDTVLSSGVRMRHVATDMLHDFDLTAAGIELAAGRAEQADVLLVLEDHGVPDPGFIENLREFFVDERRQGSTFYLRNGSPFNASSRALFAYVGGLADIEGKNKPIEPVTSSFAIRLEAINHQLLQSLTQPDNFGSLQYRFLPKIMQDPINCPPKSLCLTHHQKNSMGNATSAVYWNARTNGVIDRDQLSFARGLLRTPVKYLGRSFHVLQARRYGPATSALVTWLGLSGLAGWWFGRYLGDEGSAQKLVQAHPNAARSD